MTVLRTLLAPTDLSAPSRHAAQRAALLAAALAARLELLYVLEGGALDRLRRLLGQDAEPVAERLQAAAREALARLAADLSRRASISPGTHLASGPVLAEILAAADALAADLIVLGARGASFMRHTLLGSTAERLLRKSLHPLLVVKQMPYGPYRNVLVPVDFSPWTGHALRLAKAVAPEADLIALHAFEVPFEGHLRLAGVDEDKILAYRTAARDEALASLGEAVRAAGLKDTDARLVVVHGRPGSVILEKEEEEDIDLIVIGKHGTGLTEELLLGSVTKRVLADSRCDVLVAQGS